MFHTVPGLQVLEHQGQKLMFRTTVLGWSRDIVYATQSTYLFFLGGPGGRESSVTKRFVVI